MSSSPRPVFDQGNGRDRRPAGDAGALPVDSSSPSPEPDGSGRRGSPIAVREAGTPPVSVCGVHCLH